MYIVISNDITGNKKKSLLDLEATLIRKPNCPIVIDNTNLTKENRKEYIDICKKYEANVKCIFFDSSIEDCQVRILHRQFAKFGKLFMVADKDLKDPSLFPVSALFMARKVFQKPKLEEGFSNIEKIIVPKFNFSSYPNKAIFFDIDGTLRHTEHLPNKYPTKPEEVILHKDKELMKNVIENYRKNGYLFFGVSNQSGISKGVLTEAECDFCMEKTKELLDFHDIEIKYRPHVSVPISCYCRKPQSGLGMYFKEKYKVNPENSLMVGDMTTDKTFAMRLGMKFVNVDKFFI